MHEVLVNRLGGLSLPRKSVVRLTDHPDMTLVVHHGRKATIQHTTAEHPAIPNRMNIFSHSASCRQDQNYLSNFGLAFN